MSSTEEVWLTQEAYDRLAKELTDRTGPIRAEIVERIEQARSEGDLKENGGYHAAREEQGKNEGRIAYLKQFLETAKVGDAPEDNGIVEPGMVVTATIAGRETKFLFGSREIGGDTDLDVFSEKSAIGAAINGKKVGDEFAYTAPNGKDIPVKVVEAKPYKG
ncbi:MAG: transcription elongation factor GreA [Galactobacter sp.]|uniref:transcription elongation factor GreA n=1 Tax=Galactobacter sp. TaxID=2676125 RepID=UPI0025C0604B|nr:transcription elongation factor GreA [Galactobacter sp.]